MEEVFFFMPKNKSEDLYEKIHVVTNEARRHGIANRTGVQGLIHHEKINGGGSCASKDYISMYRMQAA